MDRVLFPGTGFTTNDAVTYYRAIANVLLPHLRNVPLSFKRFPDTIRGEAFWEKDAPSFTPKFVKTYSVPRRSGQSHIRYIVANDARTLAWLASIGGIELHPFLHRTTNIARATSVVFDLDPGAGVSIVECCEVALLLRDALAAIGFTSFAKVSGSKGLQVYMPLNSNATHDVTQPFARLIAEELARKHPKLIVAKMAKRLRASARPGPSTQPALSAAEGLGMTEGVLGMMRRKSPSMAFGCEAAQSERAQTLRRATHRHRRRTLVRHPRQVQAMDPRHRSWSLRPVW